jgi:hypothetical protein
MKRVLCIQMNSFVGTSTFSGSCDSGPQAGGAFFHPLTEQVLPKNLCFFPPEILTTVIDWIALTGDAPCGT